MIELLLLVKVSLIVATTAVALAVVGGKTSAASRHLICTLAIAGLLALPALSLVLPGWSPIQWPVSSTIADGFDVDEQNKDLVVTGPAKAGHYDTQATAGHYDTQAKAGHHDRRAEGEHDAVTGPPEGGHYVQAVWLLVYAVGVVLLTARLLVDRFRVRRIARHATEAIDPAWQTLFRECADELGVRSHVRLLRSEDRTTPMAIGIRRPAIVVPASAEAWSNEMRRAVLLHELAHVVRRDCLTQTAAAAACALYWVHPGSWWLARRLRIERELACDDLVLSAGTDAHDYAGHLLELAYTLRGRVVPALAVGMAAPRQLEARMLALLDRARNRTLPTRLGRSAVFAMFAATILPISAATAIVVQTGDNEAASPQRYSLRDVSAESFRRFLSVDYWRHTAAGQLSRLADQWSYLNEMRQLGYSVANVDVLFKLRQHGVTPEFVRALAAEGLSGLSTDDLLTAVSHGISADYVRDLKRLGYQPLDIETLTRIRSHGIDGDIIRELAAVGFTKLSIDDLVRSRSHGISPKYIGELTSLGYQHLSVDDLTLLRSHGVEPAFIREMKALGYTDLGPEAFAELRSHGATPTQIRSANERAGTRLSVGQLTELASHGWKP